MNDPTLTAKDIDDTVNVIEAGEVLDFIGTWLAHAPPAVIADFERYAWPYTHDELLSDMAALAAKLAATDPNVLADTRKDNHLAHLD